MLLMPIPITGWSQTVMHSLSLRNIFGEKHLISYLYLYSLTTMQGVMAIPSLFLYHNGKAAARYNETEYKVDLFASFITRYTGKPF